MTKITPIQLKASILCIVFASNTMLGFACAVGLDMAFIQHIIHHDEAEEANESPAHVHEYGKHHHHHHEKNNSEKDDCCNTKVVSFEQLDKTISQPITANFVLPVFTLPPFLLLSTSIYSGTSSAMLNYIFRTFHPPLEDIRVSIRSFQI